MKLKYYLIASEQNDYRPWITSSSAMAFFTLIIWGLRIFVPVTLTYAAGFLDPTDLMNRINKERSNRYITTLKTNDKLIVAAQGKADDMLHRSYFAHIDPDGNYVWPRIEAAGYTPYVTLGENLAMDFSSPDDLISAWMNSPTHRSNILNEKFEDQGLALSSGQYEPGHNSTLVASLFGTLSKVIAKTPTKVSSGTQTAPTNSSSQPASASAVSINKDAQVTVTQVSGQVQIDVQVQISGDPTLATARLKTQSITLLKKDTDTYSGKFTFDSTEALNGETITIEARDAKGNKITSEVKLSGVENLQPTASPTNPAPSQIPISTEAQLIKILRIIFGILSIIYLGFLVIDAIIIHRAKISRAAAHITPKIVMFILIAFVNLFAGKF